MMTSRTLGLHLKNVAIAINKRFVPLMCSLVILSATMLDRHPAGWVFAGLLIAVCLLKAAAITEFIPSESQRN